MQTTIDEMNAELIPDTRAEPTQERGDAAPQQDMAALVLAAVERERFRQHRLSDR